MRYQKLPPIGREEAELILNGNQEECIRNALVRIALHEQDWRWVQGHCLRLLNSPNKETQAIAITCLGHIARIHRVIDLNIVVPLLKSLVRDSYFGGRASDALDDIAIYVDNAGI